MIIVVSHSYIFLYKRWLILSYSKRFSKLKYAWLLEAFSFGPPPGLWSGPAGGLPDPLLIFSMPLVFNKFILEYKTVLRYKVLGKTPAMPLSKYARHFVLNASSQTHETLGKI